MKPAARIQSAIEIMDDILLGNKPGDTVIADYFKARRYAGSKDRRAINNMVFAILRSRAKLTWMAKQAHIEVTARLLVFMHCIREGHDVAALFNGDQYAPDDLNDAEKALLPVLAEIRLEDAPAHIQLEYPHWMEDDLRRSLPEEFETVLNSLNTEAPLDIRVNSLHPDYAQAQSILTKQNITVSPAPYSPHCLRSEKKVKLGGTKAYKEGLVDIQDEGSQLVALLCGAKDQELVIDFCAGAGGKTLALAAEMKNQGHLYALDISGTRLYKMRKRLERAGVTNVELHPIQNEMDPWLKQFEGRVDRLLIDAPCSGVGAWRRHPESRWKMTPDLFADLVARQERILQSASHLLKPGGRLIYATCSLLKTENEDQIEKFLSNNGDFRLLPLTQVWAETMDSRCPMETDTLLLRPDQHESDGFFCAILEKQN